VNLRSTLLVTAFTGVLLLVAYTARLAWTPWRIAGFAIAVTAFVLLNVSRNHLGEAFNVGAKPTGLVTTGIYSRIRNPIYVFASTTLFGLILFIGYLWLLLIVPVVAAIQFRRARIEQGLLAERFGEEYLAYKRTTWF
jgi:protein-S-isoprenylcysteine O-methyltransferase Ste14